jgi:hypothetical protein
MIECCGGAGSPDSARVRSGNMAEYAYTTTPKKIEVFLNKIQEVGVPPKATQAWLTSIGFTSTNDRALLSVMRQIEFVDSTGKPTALWEQFRGGSRKALAKAIEQGYQSMYAVYSDAHKRSSADLESVVKSTAPKLGKDAVSRVLSTFRALVEIADFDGNDPGPIYTEVVSSNGHVNEPVSQGQPATVIRSLGPGVTINVNVQLTLPETTDATVYEKLFAAMREHLLDGLANGS